MHHDVLDLEEIGIAIAGLTDVDLTRLRWVGMSRAWACPHTVDDLIQEAVYAAMTGRRKCPRNVSPITFLVNAMRSIASARREAEARSGIEFTLDATGTDGNPIVLISDSEPDAETTQLRAEDVELRIAALKELFIDDDEAMLVILERLDEQTKEGIMSTYDLSETAYDTILRRIRRKIRGRFPTGWTS